MVKSFVIAIGCGIDVMIHHIRNNEKLGVADIVEVTDQDKMEKVHQAIQEIERMKYQPTIIEAIPHYELPKMTMFDEKRLKRKNGPDSPIPNRFMPKHHLKR